MRALAAAALVLLAAPAWAEAPSESPRPEAREALAPAATPPEGRPAPRPGPRPEAAPAEGATGRAVRAVVVVAVGPAPGHPEARPEARPPAPGAVPAGAASVLAVAVASLPLPRPEGVSARAEAARAEAARGQVCSNPLIQGSAEASFGTQGGCGIEDPVRVRSVDGVSLSTSALMDCGTAEALLAWVQKGVRPALGGRGGGLARLDVMGDYACRGRNNRAGERLSEHAHGRAVDVGGLTLADGTQIVVLRDWPGRGLREMHRAACGPFSTVLGPAANAFHANHFHLDTAPGRRPYCR